jgi:hypothetical protein
VFQQAFVTNSTLRIRMLGGCWWGRGCGSSKGNDYGEGGAYNVVLIVELKEGKWWRDTRYYVEPFEAPEWRAHLVERMET